MTNEVRRDTAYRYLLDEANLLFLVFSREGKVVETNRYTEELLGAGLAGQSFRQVFVDFGGSISFEDLASESESECLT